MLKNIFCIHFLLVILFFSCFNKNTMQKIGSEEKNGGDLYSLILLSSVLSNANLPSHISARIEENSTTQSSFLNELFSILQDDPYLWILVDKEHPLAVDYVPFDLVKLKNASYRVNRDDLLLREEASLSLEEMAIAAKSAGLTLVASSTYRSYDYQAQVYQRNVRQMGQQAADRESARPGHSQHQLGLVVDFGSITDAFAQTAEGKWLASNASSFGWSLSYPDGYEDITGYRWESWHYRYVGRQLSNFIDTYFDGIQQYALRFIHEWNSQNNF